VEANNIDFSEFYNFGNPRKILLLILNSIADLDRTDDPDSRSQIISQLVIFSNPIFIDELIAALENTNLKTINTLVEKAGGGSWGKHETEKVIENILLLQFINLFKHEQQYLMPTIMKILATGKNMADQNLVIIDKSQEFTEQIKAKMEEAKQLETARVAAVREDGQKLQADARQKLARLLLESN